jgi:hypothetical protein
LVAPRYGERRVAYVAIAAADQPSCVVYIFEEKILAIPRGFLLLFSTYAGNVERFRISSI